MGEDNDRLVQISLLALQRAFEVHETLGATGEQKVTKNAFGDTSLLIDIESEKAIIETFKDAKIPIRIISEEHGVVDIAENPKYLGVLDGLDGTKEYLHARGEGRYGALLGIFLGIDPYYSEYIFSGFMEHSTHTLFYCQKDKGSFIQKEKKEEKISSSEQKKLNEKIKIYVDFEFAKKKEGHFLHNLFVDTLKEHHFLREVSLGVHLADVASGVADIAVNATRKKNLELAAMYGLFIEAGACVLTITGESLGTKKYLEYGQKEQLGIICAATKELGNELVEKIKKRQIS